MYKKDIIYILGLFILTLIMFVIPILTAFAIYKLQGYGLLKTLLLVLSIIDYCVITYTVDVAIEMADKNS